MQTHILLPIFGAVLLLSGAASAIAMDWTPVGNPGNGCDPQSQGCFGSVADGYNIGTYEVTNAQYAEFLNAKAASDPLGLYNTSMGSGFGGITRSGVSGSFSYSAIAGRADMPVNFVSFYDALRFANWLNNGQGAGDTETGAYTLLGGTATPSNGTTVTSNAGAAIFLTSEDEWYKAAYYNAAGTSYFDYPAGSDTQTTCATPTAAANQANCNNAVGDLTNKSSYTGSASPYGTFDQGGNVLEWTEAIMSNSNRAARGGPFGSPALALAASIRGGTSPANEISSIGFRVAMADSVNYQPLPFSQNWTDVNLITANDVWSAVPGIVGYRGDDFTLVTGTDPQTLLADGGATPIDVNANQTDPDLFSTGGLTEFEITNPVVGLNGSGTANAPFLLVHLDTTGGTGIRVSYDLVDLDASTDDAVQPVALHYRVGASGNFTNVPAGFVADATFGPSLAGIITPVSVILPPDADNQPLVELRIMTTNAVGNDEWVGVDDIFVPEPGTAVSVMTLAPVLVGLARRRRKLA